MNEFSLLAQAEFKRDIDSKALTVNHGLAYAIAGFIIGKFDDDMLSELLPEVIKQLHINPQVVDEDKVKSILKEVSAKNKVYGGLILGEVLCD